MPSTKAANAPTLAQAFAALQAALRKYEPACRDDPRFTADDAEPAPLKAICAGCPLLTQCRDVAVAGPQGRMFGVIGGRVCRSEPKPRRFNYSG